MSQSQAPAAPPEKVPSNELRDYPHVDLLFPTKYLCAADLRGRDVTVVVEHIAPREPMRKPGGVFVFKPVVTLKGKEKRWALNKTNAKVLAKHFGNDVTRWIGKEITLYATTANYDGAQAEAIRVRLPSASRPHAPEGAR